MWKGIGKEGGKEEGKEGGKEEVEKTKQKKKFSCCGLFGWTHNCLSISLAHLFLNKQPRNTYGQKYHENSKNNLQNIN